MVARLTLTIGESLSFDFKFTRSLSSSVEKAGTTVGLFISGMFIFLCQIERDLSAFPHEIQAREKNQATTNLNRCDRLVKEEPCGEHCHKSDHVLEDRGMGTSKLAYPVMPSRVGQSGRHGSRVDDGQHKAGSVQLLKGMRDVMRGNQQMYRRCEKTRVERESQRRDRSQKGPAGDGRARPTNGSSKYQDVANIELLSRADVSSRHDDNDGPNKRNQQA